jgi:hypothetical protein
MTITDYSGRSDREMVAVGTPPITDSLKVKTKFSPPSVSHIAFYGVVSVGSLAVAGFAFVAGGIYADRTAASMFSLPEEKILLWAIFSALPPGAALSSFSLSANIYDAIRLMSSAEGWKKLLTLGFARRVCETGKVNFGSLGYLLHYFTQPAVVLGAPIAAIPAANAAIKVLTDPNDTAWSVGKARLYVDCAFTSAVSTNTRFLLLALDGLITWINRKTNGENHTQRDVLLAALRQFQSELSNKTPAEKRGIYTAIVSGDGSVVTCVSQAFQHTKAASAEILGIQQLTPGECLQRVFYTIAGALGLIYCLPNLASGLAASPFSKNLLRHMFGIEKDFVELAGPLIGATSILFNAPINIPAALILLSAVLMAKYSQRNVVNFLAAALLPNAMVGLQFFLKPMGYAGTADGLTAICGALIGMVGYDNVTSEKGVGFEAIFRLFAAAFFSLSFAIGQAGLLLMFPLDIPAGLNEAVFVATLFAATALGYMSIDKRLGSWIDNGRETFAALSAWRHNKNPEDANNLSDKQIASRLNAMFADAEQQLSTCSTELADGVYGDVTQVDRQFVDLKGELEAHNAKSYGKRVYDRLPNMSDVKASLWSSAQSVSGACGLGDRAGYTPL